MKTTPPAALRAGPLLLGVILLAASCERPVGPAADLAQLPERAFTVGDWSAGGIATAAGLQCLDELAAVGANTVVFVATAHQRTRDASTLDSPRPVTPELDAFLAAAAAAKTRGLSVALKLHVDVDDGSWRGFIRPADAAAWFADYEVFAAECADAAEAAGATTLVVGTELGNTVGHEERWRRIVAAVRVRFPGRILYAASWDEAERVPFWDALDAVGVDAYYPLADRSDPGRLELLANWQPWLVRLERLSRRTGRRIVFTEIGYCSRDGAAKAPMEYGGSAVIDEGEQADLYWAALAAVSGADFVRGIWWWNYPLPGGNPGADEDEATGYSPRGKRAMEVLRESWGAGS